MIELLRSRFELTGLPSSAVMEGGTIQTSDNAAYEMMKQGEGEPEKNGYELVDTPPKGPPVTEMYDVPSPPPASHGSLPAIPLPMPKGDNKKEEGEEVVYEIISGDN